MKSGMKIRGLFGILLLSAAVGAASADIKVEDTASFLKVSNGKICVSAGKTQENKIVVSCFLNKVEVPSAEINITDEKNERIRPVAFSAAKNGTTEVLMSIKLQNGKELVLKMSASNEYINFTDNGFGGKLLVSHRSKALIIPDPISEDFVLYPDSVTNRINIPSDNFYFMNLLDGRNAVLSFLWKNENIRIHAGKDAPGSDCFNYTEISLVPGESVWIGLNAAENIWWKGDGKEAFKEEVEIKWTPPFPARWAVLYKKGMGMFPEEEGLMDRWFIIEKNPDKKPYVPRLSYSWKTISWSVWTSGLENFIYPCNFVNGKTIITYPTFSAIPQYYYDPKFTPVIYPFDNAPETPPGMKLPLTAVKSLLGNDTYNRIICVTSKDDKNPGTCDTTAGIKKIFYRNEEKKEKEKIIKDIGQMDLFVFFIRKRIKEYMDWNRKIDDVLMAEEANNKNISDTVCWFRKGLSGMKWLYADGIKVMKTPEYCSALSQKYIGLIDSAMDEEQKEEQCKKIGSDIRTIGGRQDRNVAILRIIVKALRGRATCLYMFSSDEREKSVLGLIRKETSSILHEVFVVEGK